jgi:hypothetical protein
MSRDEERNDPTGACKHMTITSCNLGNISTYCNISINIHDWMSNDEADNGIDSNQVNL